MIYIDENFFGDPFMEDDKKKQVMIGIVIACIILAVGITVYTNTGGGGGGKAAKGKILILCSECNESSELSREELREKMQRAAGEGGPMGMGPMGPMGAAPVLSCPGCGKDAAQIATKCKSCDAVFNQASAEGDYPDRCPECDYSEMEEKMGQRQ